MTAQEAQDFMASLPGEGKSLTIADGPGGIGFTFLVGGDIFRTAKVFGSGELLEQFKQMRDEFLASNNFLEGMEQRVMRGNRIDPENPDIFGPGGEFDPDNPDITKR